MTMAQNDDQIQRVLPMFTLMDAACGDNFDIKAIATLGF